VHVHARHVVEQPSRDQSSLSPLASQIQRARATTIVESDAAAFPSTNRVGRRFGRSAGPWQFLGDARAFGGQALQRRVSRARSTGCSSRIGHASCRTGNQPEPIGAHETEILGNPIDRSLRTAHGPEMIIGQGSISCCRQLLGALVLRSTRLQNSPACLSSSGAQCAHKTLKCS